jgi:hypothetical protein
MLSPGDRTAARNDRASPPLFFLIERNRKPRRGAIFPFRCSPKVKEINKPKKAQEKGIGVCSRVFYREHRKKGEGAKVRN